MRHLFKGRVSNSNPCSNLLNPNNHLVPGVVQLVCLSILTNQSSNTYQNPKKPDKKTNLGNPREVPGFGPLFNEILGILGTGNITVDKDAPCGFSVYKETQLKGSVTDVCENADERKDDIKLGACWVLENEGSGTLDEIEMGNVSDVVHKVTKIVRSGNTVLSMEERLENADFEYSGEVVEKVLKRCFKVPQLALRFFNWVRFRKGFQHTVNTFNTMISIAGEAREFGLVEELSEQIVAKDVKTWTILLSHYGKAKRIGEALLVFEKMKKAGVQPDAVAYRIMLHVLCNAGKSDLALEFYKEMVHNEMEIDAGLYKELLKCFAMSGDVVAVRMVGDNMIRISDIPEHHVYGLMLKGFCIAGRIKEALELIRDLKNKNISLGSEMFETLVKGLCSADRVADAMEIVEIMAKRNVGENVYGILIGTYLKKNQVDEAYNLFQDVKNTAHVSVSTYTSLMQHLFWMKEFQKGLALYDEMLERGMLLDSVAITAVASGYIQNNCISEAWKVFKSMDEKGIKPTSKSYTIFIKELCKVSKTDEIIEALNEMKACNLNIPDNIFRHVLSYLEKKGETEKLNAMMRMQRGFIFYSTLEPKADQDNQAEAKGKSGTNQIAQERLSDCLPEPEPEPKARVNPDIAEICQILSSSSNWSVIQEKLEKCSFLYTPDLVVNTLRNCAQNIGIALKFFAWVGKQTGYKHNEQSYNMAMKMAGQGKDFKHMRSLLYEMRRTGCSITSDTWTIMIMQYGRTGLTDIALINFGEMKLSGCKPTKSTYNSLITSLCGKKGRKIDEAIEIFQEMVQLGLAPDKNLVETYVGCLCEVNKFSDARSCIESLPKIGFSKALSYSLYFRALCRAGKLEDALTLMDEIGSEKTLLDQYTYGSLIHGLLRRGQLEEALAKMKSMEQLGVYPTVHVYTALIIHYFKEKEINKALETLAEMKERGCQPTVVTYSSVICGHVRSGQVSDAWDVFHDLKQNGPPPDFKTYSMFIDCLCRTGGSEEALKLISEMLHDGIIPSTKNFQTIIYGLNREGKSNLAQVVLKKKLDLKRRRKMCL